MCHHGYIIKYETSLSSSSSSYVIKLKCDYFCKQQNLLMKQLNSVQETQAQCGGRERKKMKK